MDGAIHRAGGPAIREECRKIREERGGCPTGEAVVTTAGKMPARYVIHTVGPVYTGNDAKESRLLASCYRNSLERAVEYGCHSVAFPSISTGAYGYPLQAAARIAYHTVREFLEQRGRPREVTFCTFGEEATRIYRELLRSTR